jgi:adenine-specific DNA-methyltransferase
VSKIDDAMKILESLGLPRVQRNERSALVLLALADIRPQGSWKSCRKPLLRIWDIMGFIRDVYKKDYAANTRETIRRQTIHQFEQARLVDRNPDEPERPTNSGKTVYCLTDEAVAVLHAYGSRRFRQAVAEYLRLFGSLDVAYQHRRKSLCIPLVLPSGATVFLSPGKHNRLQIAVIEALGPRFAAGATILYVGDTAKKHVICETAELSKLSIPITQHDKLPDIILFDAKRGWLFLIEAVTSHGPISPKRHQELEEMFAGCPVGRVYVSAFLSRSDFRTHGADIAWETEVWIAENPDHMIHFNGPRFLGPYTTEINCKP